MKYTITGDLPGSDKDYTVSYANGKLSASPLVLLKLQAISKDLQNHKKTVGSPAFAVIPAGDLKDPVSILLTLLEYVFVPGTARFDISEGSLPISDKEAKGVVT